jgi:hypothetical protein
MRSRSFPLDEPTCWPGARITPAGARGKRWRRAASGARATSRPAPCLEPPALEHAEQHYRQALGVAKELGMRPLVAHCHLGLAKLYRRTDKREQAQEHLATATTMYREMDMRFWLEQAEAELGGQVAG